MNALPNILIVDDKPDNLVALESVLAPLPVNVAKATSGEEALRLTLNQDFALAILDVQMPVMDGFELAQLLRGDERTRSIPIIFLSAIYYDAIHQFMGYQSGAVDFLTKPFNPEVLLSKVRIFLDLYRRAQEAIELSKRLEALLAAQELANRELNREIAIRLQAEEALKLAKDAAELAKEEWERTFNTVPDMIMLVDPRHRIIRANKSMLKLLGATAEQVAGKPCYELVHGLNALPAFCPHAKLLVSGKPEHSEIFEERISTSFDVSTTPIFDANGKLLGSVHVMRDITERKRNEELRDHIQRIIQHDLRSPVCNVINIAAMLRQEANLTADQLELLGYFEISGEQMLDMINNTLDLYKIETGNYTCVLESIDCLPIAQEIADNLMRMHHFRKKKIKLVLEASANGHPEALLCQGEARLLRTALQNILENALEATPAAVPVTVSFPPGPDCRITVRNQGVVPPGIRERFFDKYVTHGKHKGTGIGTYSARMMVQAMGGEVTMRTADADNETVVTLVLPR